ncbi:hypothetical protein JCM30394_05860 [Deferrisoma palaeochoriense]
MGRPGGASGSAAATASGADGAVADSLGAPAGGAPSSSGNSRAPGGAGGEDSATSGAGAGRRASPATGLGAGGAGGEPAGAGGDSPTGLGAGVSLWGSAEAATGPVAGASGTAGPAEITVFRPGTGAGPPAFRTGAEPAQAAIPRHSPPTTALQRRNPPTPFRPAALSFPFAVPIRVGNGGPPLAPGPGAG